MSDDNNKPVTDATPGQWVGLPKEGLMACDHDIITQWPDFDTMLKCLEDLNTLGLPL